MVNNFLSSDLFIYHCEQLKSTFFLSFLLKIQERVLSAFSPSSTYNQNKKNCLSFLNIYTTEIKKTSLNHKQRLTKSRILLFKYFINTFINVYHHYYKAKTQTTLD